MLIEKPSRSAYTKVVSSHWVVYSNPRCSDGPNFATGEKQNDYKSLRTDSPSSFTKKNTEKNNNNKNKKRRGAGGEGLHDFHLGPLLFVRHPFFSSRYKLNTTVATFSEYFSPNFKLR